MKRVLGIFFIAATLFKPVLGQVNEVNWASEVVEVSSYYEQRAFFKQDLNYVKYPAERILGKPDFYPKDGDSPNAWVPASRKDEEFIKVGFDDPKPISQIIIAETYNPSAIERVYAYDEAGNEYLINELNPKPIPSGSRLLNLIFNKTDYNVKAVKVVLQCGKIDSYQAIDAIGVINSPIPVKINVDVEENVISELEVQRLSDSVNSPYQDLKPILSPDGDRLYFSRANHPENIGGKKDNEDIWYSDKDKKTGEWKEAENMGEPMNNKAPNFFSSITGNGKHYIAVAGNVSDKSGKIIDNLSIVNRTDSGWSEPQKMMIENFYNNSERVNFFLSNDTSKLLMALEREDTYGGMDLYISFRRGENKWTEPLNLSNSVNTPDDESSPYLAADGKTLYFSSKGYSGYGGNDLYMTRRLDDTWQNWTEPKNLGPDINTEGEEVFFLLEENREYAYYSRGNPEDIDIFKVKMPIFKITDTAYVSGKIVDAKNGESVSANVFYRKVGDSLNQGVVSTNPETGKYRLALPANAKYEVYAEADDYMSMEHRFYDFSDGSNEKEVYEETMALKPVQPEEKVVLKNIYFDFDKATLKKSSEKQLQLAFNFLYDNPEVQVEVSGHTCNIGNREYNKELSQRRAQSVVDYLVNKGIHKEQLISKGYGEERPMQSNDTKEGREKNRRVEFKILKERSAAVQ